MKVSQQSLKIYKILTANEINSYLPYFNKLVDQYNETYHHSINKKPINADYSAFNEKIETNHNAPKFKVFFFFFLKLMIE